MRYYPFTVNLDRCIESCNTLNDLSNRVCIPNKPEDLSIHVFNEVTAMNGSKMLAEYISCKCVCKFDGRECNSDNK